MDNENHLLNGFEIPIHTYAYPEEYIIKKIPRHGLLVTL